MNEQLVSMITQLVVEKLGNNVSDKSTNQTTVDAEEPKDTLIKFYDTATNLQEEVPSLIQTNEPLIKLYHHESFQSGVRTSRQITLILLITEQLFNPLALKLMKCLKVYKQLNSIPLQELVLAELEQDLKQKLG